MKVSVIIPVYDEEKVIGECLESLSKQTKTPMEIIVVDDGSEDNSKLIIQNSILRLRSGQEFKVQNLKLLEQKHKGPGAARNLGVKEAKGDILVFVDSDMTFATDFLENLVKPIEIGETKGTFTKEEYVSNWENVWARCWNFNQNISTNKRVPENYPDIAPIFRAVLKAEFTRVGGFTEGIGWTDDWSLSRKLGYKAKATSAVCFHKNPETLTEVWRQARWVGKNIFISGNFIRSGVNLLRFSLPVSLLIGSLKSVMEREFYFLVFKTVYDSGIWWGIIETVLFNLPRNK